MKKIISMFSIVAMIISMMSTVAFASGNNLYWELVEGESEGKVVTYNLVVDAADELDKVSATFDVSGILNDGVTFVAENKCGGTFNGGTNNAKVFSITYQTAGSSFSGKVVLFKVKFDFTNAKVDSIITPLKNNRAATAYYGTTQYTLTNTAITQTLKPVAAAATTGSTGVCGLPAAGNAMLNPKTGLEENTVVTSFNSVELTTPSFVVKNGDVTKTYDASYFPTNVKGAASFIAIIRYATNAVTSNVFEMELFNGETSLGTATYVAE